MPLKPIRRSHRLIERAALREAVKNGINILSLPPELHLMIFDQLPDAWSLLALASTCNTLHHTYHDARQGLLRARCAGWYDDLYIAARAGEVTKHLGSGDGPAAHQTVVTLLNLHDDHQKAVDHKPSIVDLLPPPDLDTPLFFDMPFLYDCVRWVVDRSIQTFILPHAFDSEARSRFYRAACRLESYSRFFTLFDDNGVFTAVSYGRCSAGANSACFGGAVRHFMLRFMPWEAEELRAALECLGACSISGFYSSGLTREMQDYNWTLLQTLRRHERQCPPRQEELRVRPDDEVVARPLLQKRSVGSARLALVDKKLLSPDWFGIVFLGQHTETAITTIMSKLERLLRYLP